MALISSHHALLSHCSVALVSMLYPLTWPHVLIPILPEDMRPVMDAPYPFLLGIDDEVAGQYHDFPSEVVIVWLDSNRVENLDERPETQFPYGKNLCAALKAVVPFSPTRPDLLLEAVDQAFNTLLIDPEDLPSFNVLAVRNVVLKYLARVLKDFDKYTVLTPQIRRG